MRSKTRRWLAGLGIITCAAVTSVVATPAPAHAGECYTITVGSQGATICPWQ